MALRSVLGRLAAVVGAAAGLAGAAAAQEAGGFTSAAQAREYLAQNPTGARAEAAFRMIVDADLAQRYPDLLAAEAAQGAALQITPGTGASPADIEAAIAQATPRIGAPSAPAIPGLGALRAARTGRY